MYWSEALQCFQFDKNGTVYNQVGSEHSNDLPAKMDFESRFTLYQQAFGTRVSAIASW
jgi:hypothetical protein